MEEQRVPVEVLEKLGAGRLRAAMVDGDVENGSVMAGQISGLVGKIQPAREIIQDVIAEARQVILRLSRQAGA